jgi:GT2 family glycosyltransferase
MRRQASWMWRFLARNKPVECQVERLPPLLSDCTLESQSSTDQPVCSVCIANYNGIDVVGPCLESIVSQDFGHPIEIIVHDDASTDDSVAFIHNQFPSIRVLTSDRNVGFCVSNNRMVAEARGRFVLLLNNDASLLPDAVRALYHHAMRQEKPGILGLPQYDMETGELIDIGSRLDLFLNPIPNLDRTRRWVGMVTGACFWIPKGLWSELGGFPEFFGSLAEDLYLCCLARLRGYSVEVVPQSGFRHWVGRNLGGGKIVKNSLKTTYRRRSLTERNKLFVMVSCYPFPEVAILVSLHAAVFILEGMVVSLLRFDRRLWEEVYLSCFQHALLFRRNLLSHRQRCQVNHAMFRSFLLRLSPIPQKLIMLLKYGVPEID